MAISTSNISIPSTSWVELKSGAGDVTVQLKTNGPVWIYAGVTSAPAETVEGVKLENTRDGEKSISISGLIAGDFVWARCDETAQGQKVAVISI